MSIDYNISTKLQQQISADQAFHLSNNTVNDTNDTLTFKTDRTDLTALLAELKSYWAEMWI